MRPHHLLPILLAFTLLHRAQAAPVGSENAKCSRATAETVTALMMLKHPKRFEGRCVRLNGTVASRSIVDGVPELYARMTGRDDNPEPHEVALYSGDGSLTERLWSARENMEVVGIVSTCKAMFERAQKEVDKENAEAEKAGSGVESMVFISGPCHYHGGPIIEVETATSTGGTTRLTGDPARAKYGDAFALRSPRESVRKPVEALVKALRGKDASLLPGGIRDNWSDLTAAGLLDPAKSPYAFLLGAAHDPQIAYFDIHMQGDNLGSDLIGLACICKQNDCRKEWPIAFGDMNSHDAPPFKCLTVDVKGRINGI